MSNLVATLQRSNVQTSIRPMTLDDLPRVVEIDRLSFTLPWPANSYRFELTQNDASHCWVAVADDVVVAILVLWLIEDEAHIATIAVHPDFRGHGIGRQILLAALRDAAARGATMSTLEVRASNRAAIQLYEQFGFEIVGNRPRYYQDTHEDALIMTNERIGDVIRSQGLGVSDQDSYLTPDS
jgi:ribosomal-protein-alanine N-acetyltransferase